MWQDTELITSSLERIRTLLLAFLRPVPPSALSDSRAWLCSHSYYSWALAAPMVLSLQVFQKSLPKVSCCSPEMSVAHSTLRIRVCMSLNWVLFRFT